MSIKSDKQNKNGILDCESYLVLSQPCNNMKARNGRTHRELCGLASISTLSDKGRQLLD